jgi:hypothetical protein
MKMTMETNMSDRPEGEREHTTRKEDYKAYTERDIDEGWPYSDEPGNEESRLQGNRPYADEELEEVPAGVEGFHVEELPDPVGGSGQIGEEDDVESEDEIDEGAEPDESADPEVDPRPVDKAAG